MDETNLYDWRTQDVPDGSLFALDSYYSYDDFSGRVRIVYDGEVPGLDLFINNVQIMAEEIIQKNEHVSDVFSVTCFGKSPMRVVYTGRLADYQRNYGKNAMINIWKNRIRLAAVARRGILPLVLFNGHILEGPFISLRITENSTSADTLIIVLTQLVTRLQIYADKEPVIYDYVHAPEEPTEHDKLIKKSLVTDIDILKEDSKEIMVPVKKEEKKTSNTPPAIKDGTP